jgi:hypothetical protein
MQADVPIFQINLVSQQRNNHPFAPLILHVLHPLLHTLKRVTVGHVVHDHCNGGVANVVGDECLEALLSGSVPKLKTDGLILEENVLGDKIDTNCGTLRGGRGTC